MNEVISVIVPVYNVEEYLNQCVNSIMSQSYKNLEIILVDDGSTDNSGMMCDQYAAKDSRIVVIHKKNGGLSDARNAGLERATGEYIGFVDADDFIDSNMYERLHELCHKYEVKLACCRWCYEPNDIRGEIIIPEPTHEDKKIKDDTLIKAIITGAGEVFATISVWDRLYHKSIIREMTFPKGKCYEDLVYSVKAIINAGECAYIDETYYHYRVREGSITQENVGASFSGRIYTDSIPLMIEQVKTLYASGKQELAYIDSMGVYTQFLVFKALADDEQKKQIADEAMREVRLKVKQVLSCHITIKKKVANILRICFPNAFISYYRRKRR